MREVPFLSFAANATPDDLRDGLSHFGEPPLEFGAIRPYAIFARAGRADGDPLLMATHDVSALSSPRRTLLTVDEAAEYLRVSRRQVYNLVRAGDLPAVRVGQRLRIRPDDVDAYLEQRLEPVP